MSKTTLSVFVVMCLAHTGYRRAGVRFTQGENIFQPGELAKAQLAAIEKDPRLKLSEKEMPVDEEILANSSISPGSQQGPLANNSSSELVIDLSGVKPELAHYVAAIHALKTSGELELNSSGKPNCDDLVCEVSGEAEGEIVKVTPKSGERDEAWAIYQQLTAKSEEGAE